MGTVVKGVCQHCKENYQTFIEANTSEKVVVCTKCNGIVFSYSYTQGFVYFATNEHIENYVKIGRTDRDIESRMSELSSSSGVPGRWECIAWIATDSSSELEKVMHNALAPYHADKEFFKISHDEVAKLLTDFMQNKSLHVNILSKSLHDIIKSTSIDSDETSFCKKSVYDGAIALTQSTKPGCVQVRYCVGSFVESLSSKLTTYTQQIDEKFYGNTVCYCVLLNNAQKIYFALLKFKLHSSINFGAEGVLFGSYDLAVGFVRKYIEDNYKRICPDGATPLEVKARTPKMYNGKIDKLKGFDKNCKPY